MNFFRCSFIVLLLIFAASAFGAEADGDFSYLDPIIDVIVGLIGAKAAKLMVIFYFAGIIFRPLFTFLEVVVKATTWTVKDDTILASIMRSKIYKMIAYVLDVIIRFKLPRKDS